jgi:hypothetical protein
MAVDVQEIVPSGSGGVGTVDGAVEARYRITSAVTDTLADVEAALLATSPSTYRGLYRASPPHIDQLGGEVWIGTVRYAANAFAAVQVPTFQFTTAGGTKHIVRGVAHIGSYDKNGNLATPNPHGGFINVDEQKGGKLQAAGTDIVFPVYKFSETHYFSVNDVDNFYKGVLFSLTGRVNNGPFKGFNPGEVLFLGATGTLRDQFWWEITFEFAASPNLTNVVINEDSDQELHVPVLGGWDYLWIEHVTTADNAIFRCVMNPEVAHVEQTYYDGDFSFLGIGVD